ncbi:MAG: hypothetical protein MUC97_10395 [Bernardetiaceae bacterium]|nr:hypothetical protein [Bernardetiaceae bacterium]
MNRWRLWWIRGALGAGLALLGLAATAQPRWRLELRLPAQAPPLPASPAAFNDSLELVGHLRKLLSCWATGTRQATCWPAPIASGLSGWPPRGRPPAACPTA